MPCCQTSASPVIFRVEQTVNAMNVDTLYRYNSMVFEDTLSAGLTASSLRVYRRELNGTITELGSSDGTVTITGGTNVRYDFSSSYLSSTMPLDGETYIFVILATVTASSGTVNNSARVTINSEVLNSNTVYVDVNVPTYTLTIHHCEVGSNPCIQVADNYSTTVALNSSYDFRNYQKSTSELYATHNGNTGSSGAFEWNGVEPDNATGIVRGDVDIYFGYRETSLYVYYCLVGYNCSNASTNGQVRADDRAYLTYGRNYGSDPAASSTLIAPYTNTYEWNGSISPNNRYGTASDAAITSGAGTAHQKIETRY